MHPESKKVIDTEDNQALAAAFPLCTLEDFDFLFPTPWPIGLRKTYPLELKRRVIAASTSLFIGNKSIDNVRKKYADHANYETDPSDRLDLRINRLLDSDLEKFSIQISTVSEHAEEAIGRIMSEWTFGRIPFAIRVFRNCANKGALYESIAIARMILEQVAWATKVRLLIEADDVQNTAAQAAIAHLRAISPGAGRLYGWMSNHAHWAYSAHIKSMFFTPQLGFKMASYEYKAKNYALLILLSAIAIKTFLDINELSEKWNDYEISSKCIILINEIKSIAAGDEDIVFFSELIQI